MYAVINTFEKNETIDEIVYTLVKGEDLPRILKERGIELSCDHGDRHTEVFLFETEKEAEECMGSK